MQSPARLKHIQVSKWLLMLLEAYVAEKRLGLVTFEKALVCLTRNDYEPDLCFFGREKAARLTPNQLKFPAPDWICEVLSETTEKLDRTIKYQDYALHGIAEYWIIDCDKEAVEIHLLQGNAYHPASVVKTGLLESKVITGFPVPAEALFNSDAATAALRSILNA